MEVVVKIEILQGSLNLQWKVRQISRIDAKIEFGDPYVGLKLNPAFQASYTEEKLETTHVTNCWWIKADNWR